MLARFEIFIAVSAEVLLGYDEVLVVVNVPSFRDACYVCIKGSLISLNPENRVLV
jgi:hypothetical protein